MQIEHDMKKVLKAESEAKWVMILFLFLTLGTSIVHFGLAIFCATIAIIAATKVCYWQTIYRLEGQTIYRLEELNDKICEKALK